MRSRFLYMKFLGLLLVLIGFSYSITSFNNFFSYIFHTKIFEENLNIYIMSIGLIVPVSVFVYGVYFYFYSDFNITKVSKLLLGINLSYFAISLVMMIFKLTSSTSDLLILQVFEFIHHTFSYCLLLLAIMGMYGCFKYKF